MRLFTTLFLAVFALAAHFAVAQKQDYEPMAMVNADPVKSAKAYPNPATDFVSIKFETPIAKSVEVTLHNIIGNEIDVEKEVVDEYELRLKVKDFPTGYYLVALKTGDNAKSTIKFLKL